MIIYLDQNKWIELARIKNGIEQSRESIETYTKIKNATFNNLIKIPLSAIHYIETARITKTERRQKLGATLWELSKGITIASYKDIVLHELEIALKKRFQHIKPRELTLLGHGISHAFGIRPIEGCQSFSKREVEKSLLIGNSTLKIESLFLQDSTQAEKFKHHLDTICTRKQQLPKEKWDDWLHAMSLIDVLRPLNEIIELHNLGYDLFKEREYIYDLLRSMPTRCVDIHLHRQILKNSMYSSKITDLEDWAGVAVASCYCDVVVCEKHMADMLKRDKYQTKARVETDLNRIFL